MTKDKTTPRRLKLQVQMSVDGYIAGPNGEMDWMVWDRDDKIKKYVDELTKPVDTILLGRKMTDGFISHWTDASSKPDDEAYAFAKKMVDTPKIVFSKTVICFPAAGEISTPIRISAYGTILLNNSH